MTVERTKTHDLTHRPSFCLQNYHGFMSYKPRNSDKFYLSNSYQPYGGLIIVCAASLNIFQTWDNYFDYESTRTKSSVSNCTHPMTEIIFCKLAFRSIYIFQDLLFLYDPPAFRAGYWWIHHSIPLVLPLGVPHKYLKTPSQRKSQQ